MLTNKSSNEEYYSQKVAPPKREGLSNRGQKFDMASCQQNINKLIIHNS